MRTSQVKRTTKETAIDASLRLDGVGNTNIKTGLGFLDHLIATFVFYAKFDLELSCCGDLHVDDHHTAEDVFMVIGTLIKDALRDSPPISRYGQAMVCFDEALARCILDISNRPIVVSRLKLKSEKIGGLSTQMIPHILQTLALQAGINIHIDVLRGKNDHHKTEAAFKSLGFALREAVTPLKSHQVQSIKGSL